MISTACAHSSERDSWKAGLALGHQLRAGLNEASPDAVIVFASAQHRGTDLLSALAEICDTECIAGASSAGEFTQRQRGEGHVSALALRSDELRLRIGLGRRIAAAPAAAAHQVVEAFDAAPPQSMSYRAALVMADALAGHTEALVEELTVRTGGNHSFFCGGAGDDGAFRRTHVFAGRQALSDAVVALEIVSSRPLGIGVSHGWEPAGPPLRVTEADGMRLVSLNDAPAVHAFEDHAAAIGRPFDPADPLPFFLHTAIGIRTHRGYRLRVPLAVHDDGSIGCAWARASIASSAPARGCSRRRRSSAATPTGRSLAPKASSAASTTAPPWCARCRPS